MKTKVVFRVWKDTGDVIALFPELPADKWGHYCDSYEHVGQHGAASPNLVSHTSPAQPEEYAALASELRQIGYDLDIRAKVSAAMHRKRAAEADRLRKAVPV
jgi:hypothetical protein